MKNKILIADDEKEILDVLHLLLTAEGYEVIKACSGQEIIEMADSSVDMYVLDVNMGDASGFSIGAKLREKFYAPIMFLTAYSTESDKAMGFSAGADDYMVKPFSNAEFLMRVKALLRRSQSYSTLYQKEKLDQGEKTKEIYKDLVIDFDSMSVEKEGQVIVLTYTEFKMLELFVKNRKKIFSLDNIYSSIWEQEAIGDGTIMVHIKNLRKKLGDDSRNSQYIKTAWGKGYYVD